jgi:hypothetical protein
LRHVNAGRSATGEPCLGELQRDIRRRDLALGDLDCVTRA